METVLIVPDLRNLIFTRYNLGIHDIIACSTTCHYLHEHIYNNESFWRYLATVYLINRHIKVPATIIRRDILRTEYIIKHAKLTAGRIANQAERFARYLVEQGYILAVRRIYKSCQPALRGRLIKTAIKRHCFDIAILFIEDHPFKLLLVAAESNNLKVARYATEYISKIGRDDSWSYFRSTNDLVRLAMSRGHYEMAKILLSSMGELDRHMLVTVDERIRRLLQE